MRVPLLAALSVVLLACAARAEPNTVVPSEGEAGCASPVAAGDTAASLKKRFGGNAKITRVDGAEGKSLKALVLFANDPARRIEVIFSDGGMTKASGYRLPDRTGKWTVAGLTLGSDLATVEAANGKPFEVNGFDWDYGGYVEDFHGGKLANLTGGCTLSIRFDVQGDLPEGMSGDGVKIASTDKRLLAAGAKVASIMVNFPARP